MAEVPLQPMLPLTLPLCSVAVLADFAKEMAHQDEKGFDHRHDDARRPYDLMDEAYRRLRMAVATRDDDEEELLRRLIQAGAVIASTVESLRRRAHGRAMAEGA